MIEKCMGGDSNTRPPNTQQSDLRVLIDWVSCTFDLPGHEGLYDAVKFLYLDHLDFEEFEWGMNTFTTHLRSSNIVIQKKGVHTYQLFLTGQGCREYEQVGKLTWLELFSLLKDEANAVFTRLDLAVDDFKGYFNVDLIRRTFLDGRCVTRFRQAYNTEAYDVGTLERTMDSFYLGSMKSRLSVNFYDKRLERQSAGKDVEVDEWTRTELRCRKEYADMVADLLIFKNGEAGELALGILKKHVRFIRKSKEKNKSRIPSIKWWVDFLRGVDGVQLSLAAPDKTIETTKDWLSHSVMPSLAMLKQADPVMFKKFMMKEIEDAVDRLNSKHRAMIENYKMSQPDWVKQLKSKARLEKTLEILKQKKTHE